MKRAIGGIRVSTVGQARNGYGIHEQERDVQAHCARHGYQLVEIIRDEGESGTLKRRPGLLAMIERAKAGAADVVVYPKIDRLGRDALLILQTLEFIRSQGIPVEYADYHIDVSTPAGRLQEVVMAGFAGYELELIRARLMAGRNAKAKSGRLPANIRGLGYRTVGVHEARALPEYAGRDGEVLWIPAEVAVVREIYTRYVSGELSQRGLAVELNARSLRTVKGNLWSQGTVRLILVNPIYRGELRYPEVTVTLHEDPVTGKKSRRVLPVPPELQHVYALEPVIEPALWHQAQERLRANQETRSGRPPAHVYLLSGLVYCDVCRGKRSGHALRCGGTKGGSGDRPCTTPPSRYYMCASRSRLDLEFCGVRVPAEPLEARVRRLVLKALEPGELGKLARADAEQRRAALAQTGDQREQLCRTLAELKAQEGKLLDLALVGFSLDTLEDRLGELQTRRAATQEQLRRLDTALAGCVEPAQAYAAAEAKSAAWRAQLEAADGEVVATRRLYEAFLRVYLRPHKPPRVVIRWD